jgi:hypothetical protein
VIVFDLKCGAGHVFEAWFGSSASYDEQRAAGLVSCPVCGDAGVEKAVMAPNVAAKGNRRAPAPAPGPEAIKAAMAMIAAEQARALETSVWVGPKFAAKARAMHDGDEPHAQIHGQATPQEARDLIEDGVAVAPLLVPVVPPEAKH